MKRPSTALADPRDLRVHERAARERDRDRRAELDARRVLGGERERQ